MATNWIRLADQLPPVSRESRKYWLELYVPDRAQGDSLEERRKALALGLHVGNGNFRCIGSPNLILERVTHWRRVERT